MAAQPAPVRSNRIGDFERGESIGKGSFATVYQAVHLVRDPLLYLPGFVRPHGGGEQSSETDG